jgi:uncharacterized membrane protein
MIRAQVKTVVNRPVGQVFAYLADFCHLPHHDRWVRSV